MNSILSREAAIGLRLLSRDLFSSVYPERCGVCGGADVGDGLGCVDHRLALGLAGARCGKCAASIALAFGDGATCAQCRRESPGYARAVALLDYRAHDSVRAWVLALKYGRRAELARPLGALLGARLALEIATTKSAESSSAESNSAESNSAESNSAESNSAESNSAESNPERVLVPVPLHVLRRMERGYDQARLLAEAAGHVAGLRVVPALSRTRFTPPQGAPGSVSRTANVDGAFARSRFHPFAARQLEGREVWLVDDVLTSGATAAECARAVRRLGAARVCVLALARA
jgi:predicted amidophosphoribosyltransferase